jgi:nitrite reductase/ring-hydroxylating ferredoxin subunit
MIPESPTLEFHPVARSNEIPEGALLGARLGDRELVLGRFEGRVYALDGACSHQGAPLCEGDLDGPVLSCPLHNGAFDLRTGVPERLPVDTPIARYAVREVGDVVQVSLVAPEG